MNRAEQRRVDQLFVAIGKLEARAYDVARTLPYASPERVTVGDVASALRRAWVILTDAEMVK